MQDLHPELAYGFEKCLAELGFQGSASDGEYLTVEEVLRAHFLIADYFLNQGEGIGGVGPRSMGLLESAVSRQWVGFQDQDKWKNPYEKAATVLFGLVCNHPFRDANKRTALLSTAHYLRKCGVGFVGNVRELEQLIVDLADRRLNVYVAFGKLLEQGDVDPEVRFLASFLRERCRRIEHGHRTLTYRELDSIIKGFGFFLDDPKGNRISIVKNVEVRTGIFKNKKRREKQRICRIGFPGWSKQAGKKDIKFLRKKLELDEKNGVDAASFFQQADDMRDLIKLYKGALNRLADK